ncbi:UvrD-helicase domain-containing protein [Micromonospora arborensis]|uniref:UvrD-helicase domain-containing protein n=1 Tax=Micromonospora arborensis TaxID=2116518 RepID=UPI003407830A
MLRKIQGEQRPATAEEQKVLAGWGGWGAVAAVFDNKVEKYAWVREELAQLLNEKELAAAARTTLNAHYTDVALVKAIWDGVGKLGWDGGRGLEPGCGSGTFLGLAPANAQMTGVELDPITAAIAAALYPHADVRAESFAHTRAREGSFDAVVGNVPFGDIRLHDRRHNLGNHVIHNHFIIKSLRLARPGGLVAVITSAYTMDAANPAARREMQQLGDLVGAVRLPSKAHARAAGTDALTDVLIFRRREDDRQPAPFNWEYSQLVDVGEETVRVNAYFQQQPGRVLGELATGDGLYRSAELSVVGDPAAAPAQLAAALDQISAEAREAGLTMTPLDPAQLVSRPAALLPTKLSRPSGYLEAHRDGSFTRWDENGAEPYHPPKSQAAELRDLLRLRDAAVKLLEAEAATVEDTDETDALRTELNDRYDRYKAQHGAINRFTLREQKRRDPVTQQSLPVIDEQTGQPKTMRIRPVQGGFRTDPFAPVVAALENFNEENQTARKADIFSQRVVAQRPQRLGADTPADALAIVRDEDGEVRLPKIAWLLGVDEEEAREALGTLVYDDPVTGRLEPASAYLSGHVRDKLAAARTAAEDDPRFEVNVTALAEIIPRDLGPDEITAPMGAPWIDAEYVQQFLAEILEDPNIKVEHAGGSMWDVHSFRSDSVAATSTWGTDRMPGPDIAQHILEQRSIKIVDTVEVNGVEKRIPNLDATIAANEKAVEMRERWAEWIWSDPKRTATLARKYNDLFNSEVLRSYDDVQLSLPGMSMTNRKPRPHQTAAVARMIAEPGVGLYHSVGAGKTMAMIMGVMELRRLELVRKPMIVVPNNMLEQFTREFLQTYPRAKVLAATKDDLAGDKRRALIARVATGDWDAVIMTEGGFLRLPMSPEAQERYVEKQLEDIQELLDKAEANGNGRSVKRLERKLARKEQRTEKKLDGEKDQGIWFELTGIDYIVRDESDRDKNLMSASNLEGMSIDGSQRASQMDMKLQYLREKYSRWGVRATGTPVANSMVELYTEFRYLRPDLMKRLGIRDLDSFLATFAEPVTSIEVTPDGGGLRSKSRVAKFFNVPELIRQLHIFADVKTKDDLDLPRPPLAMRPDGQRLPEVVVVPPSDELLERVAEHVKRAERVRGRKAEKGGDNILKVITEARGDALDLRLRGGHTDEPQKVDVAADKITKIWRDTADRVYLDANGEEHPTPGALQLVFCDMGTPGKDRDWTVYDELRDQLVARGMPREKIRFIHEAHNDRQKWELFQAARDGRISVLIGSTEKMGAGTNVQDRAVALHHLDPQWRPRDIEQREGRVDRQGNQNPEIRILRYVTERSFDAYMWQTVERKAKFIDQIMRGHYDGREAEDLGEGTMSAEEMKAAATGNPLLVDHAVAKATLTRLDRLERAHGRNLSQLRWTIRDAEQSNTIDTALITEIDEAITRRVDTRGDKFAMTVRQQRYDKRSEASNKLRTLLSARLGAERGSTAELGELGGFAVWATTEVAYYKRASEGGGSVNLLYVSLRDCPGSAITIKADELATADIVTRLENRLHKLELLRAQTVADISRREAEVTRAQQQLTKPFKHADALEEARRLFIELDAQVSALAEAEERSAAQAAAAEAQAAGAPNGAGQDHAAAVGGGGEIRPAPAGGPGQATRGDRRPQEPRDSRARQDNAEQASEAAMPADHRRVPHAYREVGAVVVELLEWAYNDEPLLRSARVNARDQFAHFARPRIEERIFDLIADRPDDPQLRAFAVIHQAEPADQLYAFLVENVATHAETAQPVADDAVLAEMWAVTHPQRPAGPIRTVLLPGMNVAVMLRNTLSEQPEASIARDGQRTTVRNPDGRPTLSTEPARLSWRGWRPKEAESLYLGKGPLWNCGVASQPEGSTWSQSDVRELLVRAQKQGKPVAVTDWGVVVHFGGQPVVFVREGATIPEVADVPAPAEAPVETVLPAELQPFSGQIGTLIEKGSRDAGIVRTAGANSLEYFRSVSYTWVTDQVADQVLDGEPADGAFVKTFMDNPAIAGSINGYIAEELHRLLNGNVGKAVSAQSPTPQRSETPSAQADSEQAKPLRETQRHRRGHDFYPPADADIPALYDTDGIPRAQKVIHAHYFSASSDFWVAEYDAEEGLAFGYTCLDGDDLNAKWRYISLPELERAGGGLNIVERDLDWTPRIAAEADLPGQRALGRSQTEPVAATAPTEDASPTAAAAGAALSTSQENVMAAPAASQQRRRLLAAPDAVRIDGPLAGMSPEDQQQDANNRPDGGLSGMRFMNESDIADAQRRWADHPVLGPAADTLAALVEVTNQNSDGWPYYAKPARSAAKVMELIEGDGTVQYMQGAREDATAAKLSAALAPIKAFRTRSGWSFEIYEPSHRSSSPTAETPAAVKPAAELHDGRPATQEAATVPAEGLVDIDSMVAEFPNGTPYTSAGRIRGPLQDVRKAYNALARTSSWRRGLALPDDGRRVKQLAAIADLFADVKVGETDSSLLLSRSVTVARHARELWQNKTDLDHPSQVMLGNLVRVADELAKNLVATLRKDGQWERVFGGPLTPPATDDPQPQADEQASTADGRAPRVHHFASSGEAYNASQVRDDIRSGDVLVVTSEGVIGVLDQAWPVALTEEQGDDFHTVKPEHTAAFREKYRASIALAEAEIEKLAGQPRAPRPAPADQPAPDAAEGSQPEAVTAPKADERPETPSQEHVVEPTAGPAVPEGRIGDSAGGLESVSIEPAHDASGARTIDRRHPEAMVACTCCRPAGGATAAAEGATDVATTFRSGPFAYVNGPVGIMQGRNWLKVVSINDQGTSSAALAFVNPGADEWYGSASWKSPNKKRPLDTAERQWITNLLPYLDPASRAATPSRAADEGIRLQIDGQRVMVLGTKGGPDEGPLRALMRDNGFYFDRDDTKMWRLGGWRITRGTQADRDAAVVKVRAWIDQHARPSAPQGGKKFPPTAQQQAVINAYLDGKTIVVQALAGTGKTSTLQMLAEALPDARVAYIAFNKSIAAEAQGKFGSNVTAQTSHSFARTALTKGSLRDKLKHVVKKEGWAEDWASTLKITDRVQGDKTIDAETQARWAMATVKAFRQSDADTITIEHLPDGFRDQELAPLRQPILEYARKAWADKADPAGQLPFVHDDYLKLWALQHPRLPYDVIYFDEAQDINPVLAKLIKDQPAQKVVVGDSNQSIYSFRGAVDALNHWPADVVLPLTQSWRFGPGVAEVGNSFLQLIGSPYLMTGNPGMTSTVGPVDDPEAVLAFTNAGCVTAVFDGFEAHKEVALLGGGKAIKEIAQAALDLQAGRGTTHPELSRFADWRAVQEYVDGDDEEAQSLQAFVRLVDRRGAEELIKMADRLTDEKATRPDGTPAYDLTVSTVHKSKGLEWDRVRIASDGPRPEEDLATGKITLPDPEKLRQAYVAVTRARGSIDLGSLAWIQEYPIEKLLAAAERDQRRRRVNKAAVKPRAAAPGVESAELAAAVDSTPVKQVDGALSDDTSVEMPAASDGRPGEPSAVTSAARDGNEGTDVQDQCDLAESDAAATADVAAPNAAAQLTPTLDGFEDDAVLKSADAKRQIPLAEVTWGTYGRIKAMGPDGSRYETTGYVTLVPREFTGGLGDKQKYKGEPILHFLMGQPIEGGHSIGMNALPGSMFTVLDPPADRPLRIEPTDSRRMPVRDTRADDIVEVLFPEKGRPLGRPGPQVHLTADPKPLGDGGYELTGRVDGVIETHQMLGDTWVNVEGPAVRGLVEQDPAATLTVDSADVRELPPPAEIDPVARWRLLGNVSVGTDPTTVDRRQRMFAAMRRVHELPEDASLEEIRVARDADDRRWRDKCLAYWDAYAVLMAEEAAPRTAAAEPFPKSVRDQGEAQAAPAQASAELTGEAHGSDIGPTPAGSGPDPQTLLTGAEAAAAEAGPSVQPLAVAAETSRGADASMLDPADEPAGEQPRLDRELLRVLNTVAPGGDIRWAAGAYHLSLSQLNRFWHSGDVRHLADTQGGNSLERARWFRHDRRGCTVTDGNDVVATATWKEIAEFVTASRVGPQLIARANELLMRRRDAIPPPGAQSPEVEARWRQVEEVCDRLADEVWRSCRVDPRPQVDGLFEVEPLAPQVRSTAEAPVAPADAAVAAAQDDPPRSNAEASADGTSAVPAHSPYQPGDRVQMHGFASASSELGRTGFVGIVHGYTGSTLLTGITDGGQPWTEHWGALVSAGAPNRSAAACTCCPQPSRQPAKEATSPVGAPLAVSITRTRMSIGSQIQEAANILGLPCEPRTIDGTLTYEIAGQRMSPGEAADYLLEGGAEGALGRAETLVHSDRLAERSMAVSPQQQIREHPQNATAAPVTEGAAATDPADIEGAEDLVLRSEEQQVRHSAAASDAPSQLLPASTTDLSGTGAPGPANEPEAPTDPDPAAPAFANVPTQATAAAVDPAEHVTTGIDPGPFSAVELAKIRAAVQDHAAKYYGQRGALHFGESDAVRYVSEGYLGDLVRKHGLSDVWDAVAATIAQDRSVLTHDPKILRAALDAASETAGNEIKRLFDAGDHEGALNRLDAAELDNPHYQIAGRRSWDDIRTIIQTQANGGVAPRRPGLLGVLDELHTALYNTPGVTPAERERIGGTTVRMRSNVEAGYNSDEQICGILEEWVNEHRDNPALAAILDRAARQARGEAEPGTAPETPPSIDPVRPDEGPKAPHAPDTAAEAQHSLDAAVLGEDVEDLLAELAEEAEARAGDAAQEVGEDEQHWPSVRLPAPATAAASNDGAATHLEEEPDQDLTGDPFQDLYFSGNDHPLAPHWRAEIAEIMGGSVLSDAEQALVAHACEDHAGDYVGDPLNVSPDDPERGVSHNHLDVLVERYGIQAVSLAVRRHLNHHPEILAAGRLTSVQREQQRTARDERARSKSSEAHREFKAGNYNRALQLLAEGELASPGFRPSNGNRSWDDVRMFVERAAAAVTESPDAPERAEQPAPPAEQAVVPAAGSEQAATREAAAEPATPVITQPAAVAVAPRVDVEPVTNTVQDKAAQQTAVAEAPGRNDRPESRGASFLLLREGQPPRPLNRNEALNAFSAMIGQAEAGAQVAGRLAYAGAFISIGRTSGEEPRLRIAYGTRKDHRDAPLKHAWPAPAAHAAVFDRIVERLDNRDPASQSTGQRAAGRVGQDAAVVLRRLHGVASRNPAELIYMPHGGKAQSIALSAGLHRFAEIIDAVERTGSAPGELAWRGVAIRAHLDDGGQRLAITIASGKDQVPVPMAAAWPGAGERTDLLRTITNYIDRAGQHATRLSEGGPGRHGAAASSAPRPAPAATAGVGNPPSTAGQSFPGRPHSQTGGAGRPSRPVEQPVGGAGPAGRLR